MAYGKRLRAAWAGLGALLAFAIAAVAADETPAKRIVLVKGESVDTALFESVVKFTGENLSAVIVVGECPKGLVELPPKEQFARLSQLLGKDDYCAVAILHEPDSIPERVLLTRETRSGVVNLSRLQLEVPDLKKDAERFTHLIHKETMLTIGYILGLRGCVNPLCAMSGYKLQPGATFGRNYCPPCMVRMDELLGLTASIKQKPVPEKKTGKEAKPPAVPRPAGPIGE